MVICSEDVANMKPHPEGLEIAMKRLRKEPGLCCYVGDSPEDIEMGRRARVLTVGIPSRYPASRKLPASNPDLSFASLEEFMAAFIPAVLA
jgi:phosphoglycolate phosphatase-like HAD superfamily hydrolase